MTDILTLRDIEKGHTTWRELYEAEVRETGPLLDRYETAVDELANAGEDIADDFNSLHEAMRQHEHVLSDLAPALLGALEIDPAADPLDLDALDVVYRDLVEALRQLGLELDQYKTDPLERIHGIGIPDRWTEGYR
jgi:hypothetical protein